MLALRVKVGGQPRSVQQLRHRLLQRQVEPAAQVYRPTYVNGDELEHTILGEYADDSLLASLVVPVDEREAPSVRAHQRRTRLAQRSVGVD